MIHCDFNLTRPPETSASRLQLDGGSFEYLIFVWRAFSPLSMRDTNRSFECHLSRLHSRSALFFNDPAENEEL